MEDELKEKTKIIMDNQEKNNQKPHVQVFGMDVNSNKESKEPKEEGENNFKDRHEWRAFRREMRGKRRCYCGHHHGSGIFGLALLLVGILFLFNSISILPWNVWQYIWPFWPALLILVGLRIIFGHNWGADGLIFLIGFALFAFIILYALVHTNSPLASHLPPKLIDFINSISTSYRFK